MRDCAVVYHEESFGFWLFSLLLLEQLKGIARIHGKLLPLLFSANS